MKILLLAALIVLFVALSCADGGALAWYNSQGTMKDSVYPKTCERFRQDYWRYAAGVSSAADAFTQRMTQISMINAPDHILRQMQDEAIADFGSQNQLLTFQFDHLTGWSENQYAYCAGRYQVERHRSAFCDQYRDFEDWQKSYYHLGAIGRCIDYKFAPVEESSRRPYPMALATLQAV